MKFTTAYTAKRTKEPYEKVKYHEYEEVPPHYVDKKTGEVINDTAFTKRVVKKDYDLQEVIQSYAESCCLTALLAKVKKTGDASLLLQTNSDDSRYGVALSIENQNDLASVKQQMQQLQEATKALEKKASDAPKVETPAANTATLSADDIVALKALLNKKEGK